MKLRKRLYSFLPCAVLWLMLLFPVCCFSQSTVNLPIQTEQDLISALISAKTEDHSAASYLLNEHKHLITSNLVKRLASEATRLSASGDSSGALLIYEIARAAALLSEDGKIIGYSYYKIGRFYFARDRIPKAIENYLQSKHAYEQVGARDDLVRVLSELGTLYIFAQDFQKAKAYSQQSLSLAKTFTGDGQSASIYVTEGVATSHANLGYVSKEEGEYDEALNHLSKSLSMYKQMSVAAPIYESDVAEGLATIGRTYRVMGSYTQALYYLNQSLTLAKTISSKIVLARVLNSIGILYMELNDDAKALDILNQALQLATERKDEREIATILINIGVINRDRGRYEESLKNFRESISRAAKVEARDIIAAAEQGIASVYYTTGKYTEALEWLNKSESSAQATSDKVRSAELLWRRSEVYYAKKDFQRSLECSQSAADAARQLRLPVITHLALSTLGKSYHALKKSESAYRSFNQAITQIEEMRRNASVLESERQLFFENKVEAYHQMIELLVREGQVAEAMTYAERAKGRALLDVLQGGRVNIYKAMTPDEQTRERQLNKEIRSLNAQLFVESQREEVNDEAGLKSLEERLQKARREYESFQTNLYATHRELKIARGEVSPFTLEQASSVIQNKSQAVLEYVVTKERTYLIVLTAPNNLATDSKTQLTIYPIEVNSTDLARRITALRQRISERRQDFSILGQELYALLVKPAEAQLAGKTTICIVPDGSLWELPFQALQRGTKFLIEEQAVFYAPSLSVLREMQAKSRANTSTAPAENSLLAFANPTLKANAVEGSTISTSTAASLIRGGKRLAPLPDAEREARTAANLYGDSRSRVYMGSSAREERLKAEAGG